MPYLYFKFYNYNFVILNLTLSPNIKYLSFINILFIHIILHAHLLIYITIDTNFVSFKKRHIIVILIY